MLSLLSLFIAAGARALFGLDSNTEKSFPLLPSSTPSSLEKRAVYHLPPSESKAAPNSAKAHSNLEGKSEHVTDLSDEAFLSEVKQVMRDFLRDISYKPLGTIPNPRLRQETKNEILSWNSPDLSPDYIEGLTDVAVCVAEFSYSHTSYAHQRYVSFFTAYLVVADHLGQYNIEALGQFVRRHTSGQPQLHPVLDRLEVLLRTTHDLYPPVSADAIVSSVLDAVAWMYVEVQTKEQPVLPAATRYPYYMRVKVGVATSFAHFVFEKEWAETAETGLFYLQLIPDIEVHTCFANDILSFYKEALAGESNNYVHLRAAAEQKPVIQVLRELVDETVTSIRKVGELAALQPGIAEICNDYIMGYVEAHFVAKRYRLEDLEL